MLNEEFLNYAKKFARPTIILNEGNEKTFSKFGGAPTVPSSFVWPQNSSGKKLPFYLQVDFSEINKNNYLKDFPQKGLLYLFVDEEGINTNFKYTSGEQYKIIYFADASASDSLKELESEKDSFEEKYFSIETIMMYPYDEEDEKLCEMINELDEEAQDDYYTNYHYQDVEIAMLGGWPQILQSSYLESDEVQLFELESVDDVIMWGDLGMLQFYINKEDLINCNFDNVKANLETT